MTRDEELLGYWQRAAKAELGIAITTPDRVLLRQQLYRARDTVGGFDNISIAMPENQDVLWLVRRDRK